MRKGFWSLIAVVFFFSLFCGPLNAQAAKREKFGADKRHQEVKRMKVKTSDKTFRWSNYSA